MEASIREKEFGTIGESLLERALTMYLLALSVRHVVLPLRPSLDYNISTQIGHAHIFPSSCCFCAFMSCHLYNLGVSDATADGAASIYCG